VSGWQHHELERPDHKPIHHNGYVWNYTVEWYEGKRGWFALQEMICGDRTEIIQMHDLVSQDELQMLVEMDFPMDRRPMWHGETTHTVPWDHETLKAKYQEWKELPQEGA
tara:strand:- start:4349 stop:4678 length:330 start_codon:yes stop_codon:yes gene_type:complete